ncbi:MAG: hypothetical protein ACREBU_09375 [Nitrososphaera sp.]
MMALSRKQAGMDLPVCVDFDGVLAEDTWPSPRIGNPIPEGLEEVTDFIEQGYAVIVYTARPESHKMRIWGWLSANGFRDLVYDVVCGKPQAILYLDDKAVKFER